METVIEALAVVASSPWLGVLVVACVAVRAGVATIPVLVAVWAVADLTVVRGLKPWFGRLRPCRVDASWIGGVPCGSGFSLPSAHAAAAAAVAVAAMPFLPIRWRWGLLGLAIAVGASRVVLGQHYPSDVLAGWAWGAGLGAGAGWIGAKVRASSPSPSRNRSDSSAPGGPPR